MLRGRYDECAALDLLLQRVRMAESSVVVLRGEAGIGKTALLEFVAERATGCRVARAVGVQAEMELAFAALHHLCVPMLGGMRTLPGPQREALEVAFGLREGAPPDRFLVGLATLTLLAEAAEGRPLVCLIDDAQWLDRASAQALAFVARRLLAEQIAMLFAVREPSLTDDLAGLPELHVKGLRQPASRSLLASAVPGPVDARVRERILAETRGNPLALIELPRGLTPVELAAGFRLRDGRPLVNRIEQTYLQRVQTLPLDTQRLLLTAAAEPLGDSSLLWRAAERLEIRGDAGRPAEAAGLIELGAHVRFNHPLVRSAVYLGAQPADRRAVHRALAESTDPAVDPDRRAWHRAQAAVGLDEDVASELERSAERARARGGMAASAAFLRRATELTPEPPRRAVRALAAARAQLDAGAPDTAYDLLAAAEIGPLDELHRAQAARLRAEIAFARRRGSDAPPLLLDAARRLERFDAELARDTYLDALSAALYVGRSDGPAGVVEVAKSARAALAAGRVRRAPDLLLEGLAVLVTDGYPAGAPVLRHALRAFREDDAGEDVLRWLWLAIRAAGYVWDDVSWDVLTTRHLQHARDAGALTELPVALAYRAGMDVHAGELDAASALIEEASALPQSTGSAPLMYASLMVAAWQGREERVSELIGAAEAERAPSDEGRPLAPAEWMRAVLCNGLGRYDDALMAGERATKPAHELGPSLWALPELIEAAARTANVERASDALQRLSATTRASGGDWALGIEARSRALLSDGEMAESLYREAVARLARTRVVVHLGRAQLLYGEWLRRGHRRLDAREPLRAAHETFSRIGALAFAERARRELRAIGESVRRSTSETRDALTPKETQIARLAAAGNTNPEIGARLFISPRTVEYHLRKVFTKVGVNSRNELRQVFAPPVSS